MSEIRDSKIRESILTTDGNIVIAADAGTGKTYMTVERIKHDVMKVDNYQTYAAITFTNKAAKELMDRLGEIQQGFVGTNDKFILNEVIIPFSKDVYPQVKGKIIKTDYSAAEKRDKGKDLLARFVEEGIIGNINDGIVILGNGTIDKKLNVKANRFTKSAKEKIQAAGGKIEVI